MVRSSNLILVLSFGCVMGTSSSTRQTITCETDPETDVILHCEPGDGGGDNTCTDVDEDGDGTPADGGGGPVGFELGDEDGDGVPDEDDCDEHPDGDGDSSELPYDVRPKLGDMTTPIADAFDEKGGQPAAILAVTMSGGTWRLAELTANTPFVVTQADCDHAGNRDVGRDRIFVTWQNADGSKETDHLDIRYCD